MIHYHGTPMSPRAELWLMAGKNFCVSFGEYRDADICQQIGQSVMWDNGSFSLYTKDRKVDWTKFYSWVEPRIGHPHWAVVPDVIDGDEEANLDLVRQWPWVHMMRGLSIGGKRWPFASADSTNVTLNFEAQGVTAEHMARQVDASQCPINWTKRATQQELLG